MGAISMQQWRLREMKQAAAMCKERPATMAAGAQKSPGQGVLVQLNIGNGNGMNLPSIFRPSCFFSSS